MSITAKNVAATLIAALLSLAIARTQAQTKSARRVIPAISSASLAPGDAIALFNGRDFSGWTYFLSDKNARWQDTWSIDPAEQTIICKGRPAGYIRTTRSFKNYVLRLEWRFPPGRAGNSGVLLRMVGRDMVWPRSIEAQLQSGAAGDFWLIEGAALTTPEERRDKNTPRHRLSTGPNEKPVGEWNQYEITVNGDKVTLKVNDKIVNDGTGAEAFSGKICLQSEGAEVHFRNIRLTPLPD